ncbi:MAG TPA: class I SAM-dependent methyltransferase [Candidatus Acidoferrales bacterium]|nr:class I SAM-dependent methyltransferase [Candidatus Acidoferrales bacterium]
MIAHATVSSRLEADAFQRANTIPECPSCSAQTLSPPLEKFHGSSLFACASCDLHFWHPLKMPDYSHYEAAYQGRDHTAMPLEPGHRFFLADPKAPKRGRLLDLGCGVGNFLAAARDAGFEVFGAEFNRNAVEFANKHYCLQSVFAATPEELLAARPGEKFDVVTFFEVLEHQANPRPFLATAREFLAPGGFLALSVPNRARWQKGVETLDYPPNHLTRWSPRALVHFLRANGFEILSLREERLGIRRAAQVMSMALRSGLAARAAGGQPTTMADLLELPPAEMQQEIARLSQDPRQRWAARLAHWKNLAMFPPAALALPFLRLRGYTGLYLYCLARLKHEAAN